MDVTLRMAKESPALRSEVLLLLDIRFLGQSPA